MNPVSSGAVQAVGTGTLWNAVVPVPRPPSCMS
jgi:hypothetical protein